MITKKKLPKVLLSPIDDRYDEEIVETLPGADNSLSKTTPSGEKGVAIDPKSFDHVDLIPSPEADPPVGRRALPVPLVSPGGAFERRRRALAMGIVERHSNCSALGGVIPLPILSVVAVTAIIVNMLRALSRHYGVPFDNNRARSVAIGLMGGTLPTGLGAAATSTFLFIVPSSALLGLAVSSITASACTRSIGKILVDHFEGGATLANFAILERP